MMSNKQQTIKNEISLSGVGIHTGKRSGKSEISTVDTAILVAGALTAGEYFGGEVYEKAEELYKNVEWDQFTEKEDEK